MFGERAKCLGFSGGKKWQKHVGVVSKNPKTGLGNGISSPSM